MKKSYVLDTNVLIQAPYALECFEENRIVLPLAVLAIGVVVCVRRRKR